MKTIFRLVAILLVVVIVVGGIKGFLEKKQNKEVAPPVKNEVENSSEVETNILTEYIPKETPATEKIFDYSAEVSNDHVQFMVGKLNFEFKKNDSDETSLVVKNGVKTLLSKKYPDTVLSVFKIIFNNKNLILVNYYSGGAHCCSTVVPYLVDGEKITEGKGLDIGNIDMFSGDSFFIKDGKLMTQSYDDRFAYYEMDYADSGSMYFPSFYEFSLDTLKFTIRDDLFSDMYAKYYTKAQEKASTMLTKENCSKDEVGKYQTFGSLVSRYTFGYLSGVKREKLKSELATDWWCFKEKDLNKIENDIYQTLDGTSTEDFQSNMIEKYYKK